VREILERAALLQRLGYQVTVASFPTAAVSVSGNWRVTFRFENGHAINVDYVDYH
jgi:hypothetical protein